VSDEEIRDAWLDLARLEGVFCELASAAGLAALRRSPPSQDALVVCILTGHGLKDPEAAGLPESRASTVEPRLEAILEALA